MPIPGVPDAIKPGIGGRVLGVEGINQRIAQINSQIASMTPPAINLPPTVNAQQRAGGFAATLERAVSAGAGQHPVDAGKVDAGKGGAGKGGAGRVGGGKHPATEKATAMRDGIPADLAAYGNGKIPASALSSINVGQHRLWAPAAQAFQQMSAAAERQGVTIKVTDSYRSYEQQVDVANRKGLYSQGGLAAEPGTSDHGWGRSLDLGLDKAAQTWMHTNAARFGFRENVPREPWHWTFTPTPRTR